MYPVVATAKRRWPAVITGVNQNAIRKPASESAVGTIASEAFTVHGGMNQMPEPSSIMLFGSGILGLAGVARRKLF